MQSAMGTALTCCSRAENQAVVDGKTEISSDHPLSDVDVAGDNDLAKVLEGLQAAAELHRQGCSSQAAERLHEAQHLMEQLEEESPTTEIKRCQSLRRLRSVCEIDPTFRAIEADSKLCPRELETEQKEEAVPEAAPEAKPTPSVDTKPLEARLDRLFVLCREARIFEAASALQQLQEDINAATSRCRQEEPGAESSEAMSVLKGLSGRVQTEPGLLALRAVHARMRQLLSRMGPQALPSGPKDSRWVHTTIKDPAVGSDFLAEVHLRFAESGERDAGGPSTQLILCGQLFRFPMELAKFVSVYRETDLYRKEWIADAESCEGGTSGPEQLYSSYSRIINASPILPIRLEVLTVREFAVCADAPLMGHRAGILVSDMSPPPDVKEYCGWPLPAQPKKSVRLSNIGLFLYFVPNEANACQTDVFAFCRAGVPVPQWLVPLSVVKSFLAHHFLSVFKAIKLNIANHWHELGYSDRIAGCPDFYGPIEELHKRKGGAALQKAMGG